MLATAPFPTVLASEPFLVRAAGQSSGSSSSQLQHRGMGRISNNGSGTLTITGIQLEYLRL
jgi:hypothetical protein